MASCPTSEFEPNSGSAALSVPTREVSRLGLLKILGLLACAVEDLSTSVPVSSVLIDGKDTVVPISNACCV